MARRPIKFDHNGPPVFDSAADIPSDIPKMHFFKCDINALWDVLVEMPFEEGGFYMRSLLAMYRHMEGLPADDNVARMRLGGIDIRTYRRMKARLVGRPKCLIEKPSGRISNSRFEEEITEYVSEFRNRQKAGFETAEKQRVARASRPTSGELPADFQPTSGGSPADLGRTSGKLPAKQTGELSKNINEINDRDAAIPVSLRPHGDRNERAILDLELDKKRGINPSLPLTPTPAEPASERVCDGPRDGEEDIGHGVFVGAKAIRHRDFAISLDGVLMQTLNSGLSRNETVEVCKGIAIQWALDIDTGKPMARVVPSNVANFLAASVRRAASDRAQHGVRMERAGRGQSAAQGQTAETQAQRLKRLAEDAERKHQGGGR